MKKHEIEKLEEIEDLLVDYLQWILYRRGEKGKTSDWTRTGFDGILEILHKLRMVLPRERYDGSETAYKR